MNVMISVINNKEAKTALHCQADIIDIKNPEEGSLGAQHPLVIKEIVRNMPDNAVVSATLGDVPYMPCTIAQAAYAVASFGVDYVKVGIKGCKTQNEVKKLVDAILKSIEQFEGVNLVLGCYADYKETGTLNPFDVLEAVKDMKVKGILIDTLQKKGKNLFDYLSEDEMKKFADKVHSCNMLCALAGSIKKEHIRKLKLLGADITGVRGAICDNGRLGEMKEDKIKEMLLLSRK